MKFKKFITFIMLISIISVNAAGLINSPISMQLSDVEDVISTAYPLTFNDLYQQQIYTSMYPYSSTSNYYSKLQEGYLNNITYNSFAILPIYHIPKTDGKISGDFDTYDVYFYVDRDGNLDILFYLYANITYTAQNYTYYNMLIGYFNYLKDNIDNGDILYFLFEFKTNSSRYIAYSLYYDNNTIKLIYNNDTYAVYLFLNIIEDFHINTNLVEGFYKFKIPNGYPYSNFRFYFSVAYYSGFYEYFGNINNYINFANHITTYINYKVDISNIYSKYPFRTTIMKNFIYKDINSPFPKNTHIINGIISNKYILFKTKVTIPYYVYTDDSLYINSTTKLLAYVEYVNLASAYKIYTKTVTISPNKTISINLGGPSYCAIVLINLEPSKISYVKIGSDILGIYNYILLNNEGYAFNAISIPKENEDIYVYSADNDIEGVFYSKPDNVNLALVNTYKINTYIVGVKSVNFIANIYYSISNIYYNPVLPTIIIYDDSNGKTHILIGFTISFLRIESLLDNKTIYYNISFSYYIYNNSIDGNLLAKGSYNNLHEKYSLYGLLTSYLDYSLNNYNDMPNNLYIVLKIQLKSNLGKYKYVTADYLIKDFKNYSIYILDNPNSNYSSTSSSYDNTNDYPNTYIPSQNNIITKMSNLVSYKDIYHIYKTHIFRLTYSSDSLYQFKLNMSLGLSVAYFTSYTNINGEKEHHLRYLYNLEVIKNNIIIYSAYNVSATYVIKGKYLHLFIVFFNNQSFKHITFDLGGNVIKSDFYIAYTSDTKLYFYLMQYDLAESLRGSIITLIAYVLSFVATILLTSLLSFIIYMVLTVAMLPSKMVLNIIKGEDPLTPLREVGEVFEKILSLMQSLYSMLMNAAGILMSILTILSLIANSLSVVVDKIVNYSKGIYDKTKGVVNKLKSVF